MCQHLPLFSVQKGGGGEKKSPSNCIYAVMNEPSVYLIALAKNGCVYETAKIWMLEGELMVSEMICKHEKYILLKYEENYFEYD